MKARIVVLLGTYAVALALTCVLWRSPFILAACAVVVSALMLWQWHTKADVFFYTAAFVLGPFAEVVAVLSGVWAYTKPTLVIPIWLPPLWGIVGLFLGRLCEAVVGWPAGGRSGGDADPTVDTRRGNG